MANLKSLKLEGRFDDATRINVNINPAAYDYFFRKLFPGERCARNGLAVRLFDILHAECVAAGIEPTWDVTNEARVLNVLNNLKYVSAQPRPAQSRSTRTRRTNNRLAQRQQEQTPSIAVEGGTD